MNIAVVSYSMTGNNEALALSVTQKLTAEHISITETKKRTMGKIVGDLLLGRTPRIQQTPERIDGYDKVLLVGPVWMGCAATPLRPYLKQLKKTHKNYAYASISGGADGPNPKLISDLTKRTGYEPFALVDLHIADLLPAEPKPARKDTSAYKVSKDEIESLSESVIKALTEKLNQ